MVSKLPHNSNRKCSVEGCEKKHKGLGYCVNHFRKFKQYGDPNGKYEHVVKLCSIDGCSRPHHSSDYCSMHYKRFKRNGDPNKLVHIPNRNCSVEGCEKKARSLGYCDAHYTRFKKHGDPNVVGKILRKNIGNCSVEGCEKKSRALGYCTMHYTRFKKHGDPNFVPVFVQKVCSVEGCEKKARSLGYCDAHYMKNREKCSIEGCENSIHSKKTRLCSTHDRRLKLYGSPLSLQDPKITKRNFSKAAKGRTPWNKGRTDLPRPWNYKISPSEETRKKISKAKTNPSKETRERMSKAATGRKHTEKSRKSMSKSRMGHIVSKETREKIIKNNKTPENYKIHLENRLNQKFPPKDNHLEIKLQGIVRSMEIEFVTHKPILGQPDIFIEPNICIFADGDFWHGWLYLQGEDYSDKKVFNNKYFEKKIKSDKKITDTLEKTGYKVLRLWEHEIHDETEKCIERIKLIVKNISEV